MNNPQIIATVAERKGHVIIDLKQRERQAIGFLEEYWIQNGLGTWQLGGTRHVDTTEQGTCAENKRVFILELDVKVKRSFSKERIIKAGTVVRRIVYPLQGREIK